MKEKKKSHSPDLLGQLLYHDRDQGKTSENLKQEQTVGPFALK